GSVAGGIWKSEDGGATWRPINDFLSTLAISHLLVDPDDENRVFAATGEGFFNGGAMRGLGIMVSDDFGDTWRPLGTTNRAEFYYTNRLARLPNSQVILAATSAGVYRSADLGETWAEVGANGATGRGYVDLKMDPSDPNTGYAISFGQRNNSDSGRNF